MNDEVLIAVSGVSDGSMSVGISEQQRIINRSAFLHTNGMSPSQAILVNLTYQSDDYRRYFSVSSLSAGDGIVSASTITADALFTNDKNLALFLPIADCIAAVLYDPVHHVLGLSHLGRHNLGQNGAAGSIEYMTNEFATVPANVMVWLSPSVGRETYPLYDFDNRSLSEVAIEQLSVAGVAMENISIDVRDTAKDSQLFSHSEFLKANRTIDGRQAVVAMMRP